MRVRETTFVSRAFYASVATSVEAATHTRSVAKTRPRARFETLLVSLAPTMPPPIDAAAKSATMTPASAVIVRVPAAVRDASPKAAVMTMTSRGCRGGPLHRVSQRQMQCGHDCEASADTEESREETR